MFRASALRQRKRRRENARNASCRNSLWWPIYTINVLNKTRVSCVRSKFSNPRFSPQVVTTGTNSYLMRKARVTVYKSDTADDTIKLSIFLYRHHSISASESRQITYDSFCLLGMRLRVICAVKIRLLKGIRSNQPAFL